MNESEIKQIVKHLEQCRRLYQQCNDLREDNGMSIRPRLTSDEVMALSRERQDKLRSAEAARQAERKRVEEDLLVHLVPLYEMVHALRDETETANDTAKGRLANIASAGFAGGLRRVRPCCFPLRA